MLPTPSRVPERRRHTTGKGLNVSFTLDHYGVDTTILGFFAGFSGEFIVKGAEALGVPVKPVW